LKALNVKDENAIKDGEKISLLIKDLGTCDLYPTAVKHSPNGHVFALYNDSEYIIYRTQNFINSGYGTGTDLVWSINGDFAVRDKYSIVLYKNNNVQYESIKPEYIVEELYGGPLL
jgi:coatomer subunit beta'